MVTEARSANSLRDATYGQSLSTVQHSKHAIPGDLRCRTVHSNLTETDNIQYLYA